MPAFTSILALDMLFLCIATILSLAAVWKGVLWCCKKWRLGKKFKKHVVMTLWEWFKNNYKADTTCTKHNKTESFKRNKTKYSRSTYCRSRRGNTVKRKGQKPRSLTMTLRVNTAFAAQRNNKQSNKLQRDPRRTKFDSDSYSVGIDSQASCSMWNRKSAFTEIRKVKGIKVKGIGGQYVEAKGIGTVKFKLEDDSGKKHTVKIPNTLFVPDMPISLLCPQHWSQQTKDHYPVRNGTWCAILPDQCILHWDQRQFKRTVKYDEASNTPRFRTASGSELYRAFVAPLDHELNSESTEKVCFFAS